MNTPPDLERGLRATLDGLADRTVVDGQLDAIFDHVAHRRQRPAWRAALRTLSVTPTSMRFPPIVASPGWKMLAVAGVILALILATLLAVGGRPFSPPTNGRIVFGRWDPAQNGPVLYTVNPDGSHLLQLRPEAHACPHWSTDGRLITTPGAVMNGDGTGFHLLANPTGPLTLFCGVWSPDQQTIVAEGSNDSDPSQTGLWSLRSSDGGGLRQLTTSTNGGHDIPIGFAPDGSSIAFTRAVTPQGGPRLFLADPDGTNPREVGDIQVDAGDWALDGRSILVESAGRLYTVDIASGTPKAIVIASSPDEGDLGNPAWSPDGTRILFTRLVDVGGGQTKANLFQMRPDGTDVIRVTNGPEDDYPADWGTSPLVN
jgi:Tol biopolymer transport system component